jgi:hypothetical protein
LLPTSRLYRHRVAPLAATAVCPSSPADKPLLDNIHSPPNRLGVQYCRPSSLTAYALMRPLVTAPRTPCLDRAYPDHAGGLSRPAAQRIHKGGCASCLNPPLPAQKSSSIVSHRRRHRVTPQNRFIVDRLPHRSSLTVCRSWRSPSTRHSSPGRLRCPSFLGKHHRRSPIFSRRSPPLPSCLNGLSPSCTSS